MTRTSNRRLTKKQIRSQLAQVNRELRKMETNLRMMQKPLQESLTKIMYCVDKMTTMWEQPLSHEEFMRMIDQFSKTPEDVDLENMLLKRPGKK